MMADAEHADLSDDARSLCLRFFAMSPKSEVVSHKPHETISKYGDAMAELVRAGLVTKESYNRFGSIRYGGTDGAYRIGRARMAEVAKEQGLL